MTERRDLVNEGTRLLEAAGVPSPSHDAHELLAHVLGVRRSQLLLIDSVTAAHAERFRELIGARAARRPLQHLIGVAHFRNISVEVGRGVFVPRPETELLAGWAIERAREVDMPVVLDLCTGSGAIAKSIADEVPRARIHAIELDPGAFSWAERNLQGTGINLCQGDLATAFTELDGTVDVIACNPPYIPLSEFEGVDIEAREHDPTIALFSGQDGLDAIRALEKRAASLLKVGGWVGTEHADVQGESVPAIFAEAGRWSDVRDHLDLAGRPRYVTARLAR